MPTSLKKAPKKQQHDIASSSTAVTSTSRKHKHPTTHTHTHTFCSSCIKRSMISKKCRRNRRWFHTQRPRFGRSNVNSSSSCRHSLHKQQH